jgi:phasin family protein
MIDSAAPYVLHRRAVSRARDQPNPAMAKQRTKRKRKVPMIKNFDDIQKMSNANVDATVQSFEGVTKATQAIATEIADYTKRSFEDGTKTMENLLGAKSLDKAFEVQTEYAKAAYESYVSEVTKLGELYSDLAREAFKPYQSFVAKVTPTK